MKLTGSGKRKENEYTPFIKPANYDQTKKRAFKNQIGKRENMEYEAKTDGITLNNLQMLGKIRFLFLSWIKNRS